MIDAFSAIKDHFSKGGIFEFPDDLGKRTRALAMVGIVMGSLGMNQAALANSNHSLMNEYSSQTSAVVMQILTKITVNPLLLSGGYKVS